MEPWAAALINQLHAPSRSLTIILGKIPCLDRILVAPSTLITASQLASSSKNRARLDEPPAMQTSRDLILAHTWSKESKLPSRRALYARYSATLAAKQSSLLLNFKSPLIAS